MAIILNGLNSLASTTIFLNNHPITEIQSVLERPIAINDTFILAYGCNNHVVTGNMLKNDIFSVATEAYVSKVTGTNIGIFSYGPDGNFIYEGDTMYRGDVLIKYTLSNTKNKLLYSEAILTIRIDDDNDCDGIANFVDIDDDNDGILDIHEGDTSLDFDMDSIPDSYDIDSDNDGIIDYIEWQTEGPLIKLKYFDSNLDGWDDAFDANFHGNYYESVDTDLDGQPDFVDLDSDNDGYEDYIEGAGINSEGNSEFPLTGFDNDNDGLDNTFDIAFGWGSFSNSIGSNCPLPDSNSNGIRDWREQTNQKLEIEDENLTSTPEELRIFPNPTTEKCTIQVPLDSTDVYQINTEVFDINGKIVTSKTANNFIFDLNTSFLSPGTYILRINTGTKIHHTKIVKRN